MQKGIKEDGNTTNAGAEKYIINLSAAAKQKALNSFHLTSRPTTKRRQAMTNIQLLNQERYLLQEELYRAVEMYGRRTHPNVLGISQELDEVCLKLQRRRQNAKE